MVRDVRRASMSSARPVAYPAALESGRMRLVANPAPAVTVVVVTHRAAEFVAACLHGVAAQTVAHQLLVIDNASSDGTAEVLAEHIRPGDPLRTVVRLDDNRGFAGGVAAALPLVRTPFVALLNDDAVPAADWLEALLAVALLDPLGAAWTSLVVLRDQPTKVNNLGTELNESWYGVDLGAGRLISDIGDEVHDVQGFSGGAVLLRTAALRSVGGVPAEFFMYYEDLDTSLRLRKLGWQIRAVPTARVIHRHAATADVKSANFHLWNERNRLLTLMRRAPVSVAPRQMARFVATTASLTRTRIMRRPVPPVANFDPRLRIRVLGGVLRGAPRAYWNRVTWRRIGRSASLPPVFVASPVRPLPDQPGPRRPIAGQRRAR
jgi:GT2 family glycosyltransferase